MPGRANRAKTPLPCAQVDNWVYDEANSTFIEDPEMQQRLMDANPNSFRKLVRSRPSIYFPWSPEPLQGCICSVYRCMVPSPAFAASALLSSAFAPDSLLTGSWQSNAPARSATRLSQHQAIQCWLTSPGLPHQEQVNQFTIGYSIGCGWV